MAFEFLSFTNAEMEFNTCRPIYARRK